MNLCTYTVSLPGILASDLTGFIYAANEAQAAKAALNRALPPEGITDSQVVFISVELAKV